MIQTILCLCAFDERQTVSGCKSGAIYFWEEGKAVRFVRSFVLFFFFSPIALRNLHVSCNARKAYAPIAMYTRLS